MIRVRHPDNFLAERAYILDVIFREFLGLEYTAVSADTDVVSLSFGDTTLCVDDDFFQRCKKGWLDHGSMPTVPLALWDTRELGNDICLVSPVIPVLYGEPGCHVSGSECHLGLDIFGSIFFMLSRYEEVVQPDRDKHDRFLFTSSVAYRAKFLDRPIVDEYVEILWAAIHRLWPALERKVRQSRILVSCDVDHPYLCGCNSVVVLARELVTDIFKHRSLRMALQTLLTSMRIRKCDLSRDPYRNNIDWIMNVNEKVGNRVAFYFITAKLHLFRDCNYTMSDPAIRDLLCSIAERGHEIGLHASYYTYQDPAQTIREADLLRRTMAAEGIQQAILGGRQHYLRWQPLITPSNLEAAGIDYDSSLCFADRPGFRCGTCHEYPMYSLAERRPLKLRQRPLIVMESSVIAKRYMGMGYSDAALELMKSYKRICHRFGGDFTLLWHNSHLMTEHDKRFYSALVRR
ncbi:MAG: polysaccharide deacetylase family protein [Proteobacteria bacterium]|nr:polysaccharide deacetylase family protein [Pseudomonadota bacterium]